MKIPFNRASVQGLELEYAVRTINEGHLAGDQYFSKQCQFLLKSVLGVMHALVTTSCTHALEMSAILLDINPGDEIIVPSFTFVSTPNAFVMRGGVPVFCDIRPDTLNIDEGKIEALITAKTKAIVVVHYAGVGCEMDAILGISQKHGIPVVEDNAHGLFGKYKGRWLGTFGVMATQSFHETKNITCGEGGALVINAAEYVERAEIIREKGTNRARFLHGQVDKYSWVDIGSSYVMSDILAAFLYGQLEMWQTIQEKRSRVWQRYHEELAEWCLAQAVGQPAIPMHCEQAWHMYYLLLPSLEARRSLIQHLAARNISAVFHYLPLHLSEYAAQRWNGRLGDCPVTERVSDILLRLPFHTNFSFEDQSKVIAAIKEWQPPSA